MELNAFCNCSYLTFYHPTILTGWIKRRCENSLICLYSKSDYMPTGTLFNRNLVSLPGCSSVSLGFSWNFLLDSSDYRLDLRNLENLAYRS